MRLVTFDRIKEAGITPNECYRWVTDAIAHKKDAILPPKISLKPEIPGVFYNTMPSIIPQLDAGGVKLVTRYPERSPSLDSQILLYDLQTGKNLALVDGNWITTMRTGAVAAHSASLLAVKDFSVLGFIGLGNAARATLLVLLSVYPEKAFTIKLKKYKDQHTLFARRFSEFPQVTFEMMDTYEEVVRGSDVVFSAATVLQTDICSDECFQEGVLLIPIHTRGFTNCDLFFDKVYADDVNHVKGFRNFSKFRFFAEVSAVVNGQAPGRESSKERILAYNIGISLHDIYFAKKIYDRIGGDCPDISLNGPKEKFWI